MRKNIAAIAVLITALASQRAVAQDRTTGWITVSQPRAWADGQTYTLPAGGSVKVVGQAYHRSGVESIKINGVTATTTKSTAGIVDFHATITPSTSTKEIVVVVQPAEGQAVRRVFAVTVRAVLAAKPAEPKSVPVNSPAEKQTATAVHGNPGMSAWLLPGSAQFSAHRGATGAAFLAAGTGALAFGVLSKKETVTCARRTTDTCPASDVVSVTSKRPYLIPGIVAYVAIAGLGAMEARHSNATRVGYGAELLKYATLASDERLSVPLVRVQFR